jgi:hypothetical protein
MQRTFSTLRPVLPQVRASENQIHSGDRNQNNIDRRDSKVRPHHAHRTSLRRIIETGAQLLETGASRLTRSPIASCCLKRSPLQCGPRFGPERRRHRQVRRVDHGWPHTRRWRDRRGARRQESRAACPCCHGEERARLSDRRRRGTVRPGTRHIIRKMRSIS